MKTCRGFGLHVDRLRLGRFPVIDSNIHAKTSSTRTDYVRAPRRKYSRNQQKRKPSPSRKGPPPFISKAAASKVRRPNEAFADKGAHGEELRPSSLYDLECQLRRSALQQLRL